MIRSKSLSPLRGWCDTFVNLVSVHPFGVPWFVGNPALQRIVVDAISA